MGLRRIGLKYICEENENWTVEVESYLHGDGAYVSILCSGVLQETIDADSLDEGVKEGYRYLDRVFSSIED
jgi:hypothetical protein